MKVKKIRYFDPEMNEWSIVEATHKVSFWGVKCFYHAPTGVLEGVNMVYDKLIGMAIWFHYLMSDITEFFLPDWESPGFPLKILEEYRNNI